MTQLIDRMMARELAARLSAAVALAVELESRRRELKPASRAELATWLTGQFAAEHAAEAKEAEEFRAIDAKKHMQPVEGTRVLKISAKERFASGRPTEIATG